jgi:hypothetical protein
VRALDCLTSARCREGGRCTPIEGVCRATSAEDCAASEQCRSGGACLLDAKEQRCVDGRERRSVELAVLGGSLAGVGVVLIGVAAYMAVADMASGFADAIALRSSSSHGTSPIVPLMIGGVAGVGAGVPLLIVGLKRVPAKPVATVAPTIGLGTFGLTGRF